MLIITFQRCLWWPVYVEEGGGHKQRPWCLLFCCLSYGNTLTSGTLLWDFWPLRTPLIVNNSRSHPAHPLKVTRASPTRSRPGLNAQCAKTFFVAYHYDYKKPWGSLVICDICGTFYFLCRSRASGHQRANVDGVGRGASVVSPDECSLAEPVVVGESTSLMRP